VCLVVGVEQPPNLDEESEEVTAGILVAIHVDAAIGFQRKPESSVVSVPSTIPLQSGTEVR
jgi:hypothetical protein